MEFKYKRRKLQIASKAYIKFLELGGQIHYQELDDTLLKDYLKRSVPVLTGLSATHLYGTPREVPQFDIYDSIKGEPAGHFVVVSGYDEEKNEVFLADPMTPNPLGKGKVYSVSFTRLINSIMLGIVTYDANLLVIEPKKSNPERKPMPKLIIVENPDSWQFGLPDVEVISPSSYINGTRYQETKGLKVFKPVQVVSVSEPGVLCVAVGGSAATQSVAGCYHHPGFSISFYSARRFAGF